MIRPGLRQFVDSATAIGCRHEAPVDGSAILAIFLLIWLAMAVTVVVSNLASRVLLDRERAAIERQLELRDLGFEVAAIRENQGRGAAHKFLNAQGDELGLHLMMINAEGDKRLPSAIRSSIKSGWYRQKPAIVDVGDGYRLIALPKTHGEGWSNSGFSVQWKWGERLF